MDETPPRDLPPVQSRVCLGCGKPIEECEGHWVEPDEDEEPPPAAVPTPAEVDEALRLCDAATPGPWEAEHHPGSRISDEPEHWTIEAVVVGSRPGSVADTLNRDHVLDPDQDRANAALVAAAPALVRRLALGCRALAEEMAWVRKKLGLAADMPLFGGPGKTLAGTLHFLCSHAHGFEAYITAHKCDDKQGEIARLTVERDQLRAILDAPVTALFADGREPTQNERHLLNLLSWREKEAQDAKAERDALRAQADRMRQALEAAKQADPYGSDHDLWMPLVDAALAAPGPDRARKEADRG